MEAERRTPGLGCLEKEEERGESKSYNRTLKSCDKMSVQDRDGRVWTCTVCRGGIASVTRYRIMGQCVVGIFLDREVGV